MDLLARMELVEGRTDHHASGRDCKSTSLIRD